MAANHGKSARYNPQDPTSLGYTIKQIMPANGWHAVLQDGEESVVMIPLVGWALVHFIPEDIIAVTGLIHGGDDCAFAHVINPKDNPEFLRYVAPCESIEHECDPEDN